MSDDALERARARMAALREDADETKRAARMQRDMVELAEAQRAAHDADKDAT